MKRFIGLCCSSFLLVCLLSPVESGAAKTDNDAYNLEAAFDLQEFSIEPMGFSYDFAELPYGVLMVRDNSYTLVVPGTTPAAIHKAPPVPSCRSPGSDGLSH